MNHSTRIAVVDDHPLFRSGVVNVLSGVKGFSIVGEGASAQDARDLAAEVEPDVMLLDLNMAGGGLEAAGEILTSRSRTQILILTVVGDQKVVRAAFRIGIRGYLLKGTSAEELVLGVGAVARGEVCVSPVLLEPLLGSVNMGRAPHPAERPSSRDFTPREEQILSLLSHGMSNKEIAFRLDLSEKTIKYYLTHVLKKLNVRNRVEAALFAAQRTTDETMS